MKQNTNIDIKTLEAKLLNLAQSVSWDSSLKITQSPLGSWKWAFSPEINTIFYDLGDVQTKGEDFWIGVSLHEGWHRKITLHKALLRGPQKDLFHKIFNSYWFGFLLNWVEDPRVNNYIISRYFEGWKKLRETYLHSFDNSTAKLKKLIKEAVGVDNYDKSKAFTFIWWIIQNWYYWDIEESLVWDSEVFILLNKNKEHFNLIKNSYSSTNSEEEQIKIFKAVVLLTYEKIYPDYLFLLERDKEQIKDSIKNSSENWDSWNWNPSGDSSDSNNDDRGSEEEWNSSSNSKSEGKENKKQNSNKENKQSWWIWEGKEKEEDNKEKGNEPWKFWISKDKLKPLSESEIRKKLEKALQEASKELFTHEVDKDWNFKEEDIFGSKDEEIKLPEIYKDYEEKLKDLIKKEIIKQVENKRQETQEKLKVGYDKFYLEVLPYIESLTSKLKTLIQKNKMDYEYWYNSWNKLDINNFIEDWIVWDKTKINFFWRVTDPIDYDYWVVFCIDTSRSMREGKKFVNAFKWLILFSESLQRINIPFKIISFNSEIKVYKEFKEKLNEERRDKLMDLFSETGWTDDASAVKLWLESLLKSNYTDNLMFVLTDWWSTNEKELEKQLSLFERRFKNPVVWIWIGDGVAEVVKYYRKPIQIPNIEELVGNFMILFKEYFFKKFK